MQCLQILGSLGRIYFRQDAEKSLGLLCPVGSVGTL